MNTLYKKFVVFILSVATIGSLAIWSGALLKSSPITLSDTQKTSIASLILSPLQNRAKATYPTDATRQNQIYTNFKTAATAIKNRFNDPDINPLFDFLDTEVNKLITANTTNSNYDSAIMEVSNAVNMATRDDVGVIWTGPIDICTCANTLVFGDIKICETGKKGIYNEMNTLCSTGFHIPNYWEWNYLQNSWVDFSNLKWDYYIASLYQDIVIVPDYPWNTNPYHLSNGRVKHTTDVNTNWQPIAGVSGTKRDILCVQGILPVTRSTTPPCMITKDLYASWLNGTYDIKNRNYLLTGEAFQLVSVNIATNKWNFDYSLSLACQNNSVSRIEKIEKVNSCNYGYKQIDNDCVADPLICNLENLGNVHPTNSKVCSWKDIGTEKIGPIIKSSYSIASRNEIKETIGGWEAYDKENYYKKYRSQYNNKIDIKVNCLSKEDPLLYKVSITYECSIEWLFWQ